MHTVLQKISSHFDGKEAKKVQIGTRCGHKIKNSETHSSVRMYCNTARNAFKCKGKRCVSRAEIKWSRATAISRSLSLFQWNSRPFYVGMNWNIIIGVNIYYTALFEIEFSATFTLRYGLHIACALHIERTNISTVRFAVSIKFRTVWYSDKRQDSKDSDNVGIAWNKSYCLNIFWIFKSNQGMYFL